MKRSLFFTLACIVCACRTSSCSSAAPQNAAPLKPETVHLATSLIPDTIARATPRGRMAPAPAMTVDFVLPLRNQAKLSDELSRISDPEDAMYGHYLTAQQFADEYGPSLADVAAIAQFAKSQGLSLKNVSGNRTLIQVTGSSSVVESAFGVHLNNYRSADGRVFFAPDREPLFPADVATRLVGVAGLDSATVIRPLAHQPPPITAGGFPDAVRSLAGAQPQFYDSGIDGLAPSDIRSIYGIPSLAAPGSGQTLGLFELDGYTASDVTIYTGYYYHGLSQVPLQNVLVDGFSGQPQTTGGAVEVTLDIEMMIALCPYADKIVVYEAPDGGTGVVDEYAKIASDDVASVISSSWAGTESGTAPPSYAVSENQSFQQMARQGQSMFVGSGDNGAYANEVAPNPSQGIAGTYGTLSVDDPGSQPYVTAVGGTELIDTPSEGYISESTWGNPGDTSRGLSGEGSGGGVSAWWPIPSYQSGFINAGDFGSTTQRNVPDVSLFSYGTGGGYSIYCQGNFSGAGGTSASAPVWAAYTALINQGRAGNHLATIGFLNPAIYSLAKNAATYAADFHDIDDGSTNLYYPAVTGYDLATGLGSPQGSALYHDLVIGPAAKTWTAGGAGAGSNGNGCILWKRSDGAVGLWTVDAADTESAIGPTYGPYTGWTAKAVAMANDGTARVLWTNTSGQAGVWVFSAAGVETTIGPTYGPYTGWTAAGIATTPSGYSHVLWTRSDGAAGVWTFDASGTQTLYGPNYGPYAGWTAKAIGASSDATSRILWTRSDGAAGLWTLNPGDILQTVGPTYGPYPGWSAAAVGTAGDGTARVLWTNTDGMAGLWSFNASDVNTVIGTTYGPYAGYGAVALGVADDGTSRVLWDRSDRAAGVWTFGASDAQSVIGSVYGPY